MYWPASHCSQNVAPCLENLECSHDAHVTVSDSLAYVFGRHGMHSDATVLPVPLEAFPGGHPLQSVSREAPAADEYLPASHALHVVSDVATLVPLHFPFPHA